MYLIHLCMLGLFTLIQRASCIDECSVLQKMSIVLLIVLGAKQAIVHGSSLISFFLSKSKQQQASMR